MEFLGSCEVCGKVMPNYRSLATHLRHNQDTRHQDLRNRYRAWKAEYRATLRCRKCGELFTITDKADRDRKRCDRCEGLRQSMSKRAYEALTFDKPADPRQVMTASGSKAQWDGLDSRSVQWQPGDELYQQVTKAIEAGKRIHDIRAEMGSPYKVIRAIGQHAFPDFDRRMYRRKVETIRKNVRKAITSSKLEMEFADQLQSLGFDVSVRNSWTTLRIAGQKVQREADLKIPVGDGRKVIVLCDGEAFHGPGTLYVDPQERIDADRETALAFFGLGYSVLRYSETEIHDGTALDHFADVMQRLGSCKKIYRNWCPDEEQQV